MPNAPMNQQDIPAYQRFLPRPLLEKLWEDFQPVEAVPGLRTDPSLRKAFPEIETPEALAFVCALYEETKDHLSRVLQRRIVDREFMDRETIACARRNDGVDYSSPDYETVIGKKDADGRIVIGSLPKISHQNTPVEIPDFLVGDQVTLFGPPDSAKMSINAMNAFNRVSPNESPIVTELAEAAGQVPRWGADNEDSKTPIMASFLSACENLVGCFDRTIRFEDERGRIYELDKKGLSKPIKRIPGIALPDGSHLLNGNPLPLHLLDFAMHLWHNRSKEEALVFYVPKLENEEEAAYLKLLIDRAEDKIQQIEPAYRPGTIKLFIVFENPRAIFRIGEIAEILRPHFLGGSLGWHDFLASAARLFKNDPNYSIPVKADPNIVINHIRESHRILVNALAPIGAIRIGGMYGVLYEEGNPKSYEVCMVGYIRDVTTQLKRGLNGFWVAHPAFVRTGLALVEAWRRGEESVVELVKALVPDPCEHEPLLKFVFSKDAEGLDKNDPRYPRSVLAATVGVSDVIANDDPEEVRYNVFQALQYICDWLCGNGCVALPATMKNAKGETVFVRVMDDLATTERSRWELWAEVFHGRVSLGAFEKILAEELAFLRAGTDSEHKRIQVRWEKDAEKWYPIAAKILHRLATDKNPVEFATELMLPFTMGIIRDADDPLEAAKALGAF
jgi:malate synthase